MQLTYSLTRGEGLGNNTGREKGHPMKLFLRTADLATKGVVLFFYLWVAVQFVPLAGEYFLFNGANIEIIEDR